MHKNNENAPINKYFSFSHNFSQIIKLYMGLHVISPSINQSMLIIDIFHWLELITVILTLLKYSVWKKEPVIFVNISENAQENQSPMVVFWNDCTFFFSIYRIIMEKNMQKLQLTKLINFTCPKYLSQRIFINNFQT